MKKRLIPILSLTMLLITSGAWAHGGMGGMGGMGGGTGGGMGGGIGSFFYELLRSMNNGMSEPDLWHDEDARNATRLQRQEQARQQFYDETRGLRDEITQKQKAIDRELDRENPDIAQVKHLREDLYTLLYKLETAHRRYERLMEDQQ